MPQEASSSPNRPRWVPFLFAAIGIVVIFVAGVLQWPVWLDVLLGLGVSMGLQLIYNARRPPAPSCSSEPEDLDPHL